MFMKAKKKEEPIKPQEVTPTQELNIGSEEVQEATTLEEVIASKSDAWYKEKVLIALNDILETLLRLEQENQK